MKTRQQIKALIRNQSMEKGLPAQAILRIVLFEMFLEKLALSDYRQNFIVKGGFLISSLAHIELRTTMDLDVTIKALPLNGPSFAEVIQQILEIPTFPNLTMSLSQMEIIHEEFDYSGWRATIEVELDGLKERIKIDFTTGDVLTPNAIEYCYLTFLEGKSIHLKSYNVETILSEKLETILSRGVANSRTRDFYDVHLLMHLSSLVIDYQLFAAAFRNTSISRGSYRSIMSKIDSILHTLSKDKDIENRWKQYQKLYGYAFEIEWNDIIQSLTFLVRILQDHSKNQVLQ